MYAIAVNGSPRVKGNTETLLRAVLRPLEKAGWRTELAQLGGKNLRGCMACRKCFERKNMQCVTDDAFNPLFAKLAFPGSKIHSISRSKLRFREAVIEDEKARKYKRRSLMLVVYALLATLVVLAAYALFSEQALPQYTDTTAISASESD